MRSKDMKRGIAALLLAAGSIIYATSIHAQKTLADQQIDSLAGSHKIVYIDGRPADADTQAYVDSIRQKISTFYYDQFRHFSDPAAPYFLFMTGEGRYRHEDSRPTSYRWSPIPPTCAISAHRHPVQLCFSGCSDAINRLENTSYT